MVMISAMMCILIAIVIIIAIAHFSFIMNIVILWFYCYDCYDQFLFYSDRV